MSDHVERIKRIRREVAHANATVWPSGDSWIRGYAEDCNWLLAELEGTEAALHDLAAEIAATQPIPGAEVVDDVLAAPSATGGDS